MKQKIIIAALLATLNAGAHGNMEEAMTLAITSSPTLLLSASTTGLGNRAAKELLRAAKDEALVLVTSNANLELSENLKSAIQLVQEVVQKEKGLAVDQRTAAEIIVTLTTPQASEQDSKDVSISNSKN